MRTRVLFAFLSAVLLTGLAGCVSPEELRRQDEAACLGFGFQQGAADFAACLQRESLARRYSFSSGPGWYSGGPGWYAPPPEILPYGY